MWQTVIIPVYAMKKLQSGETAAHIPSLGSKQRRVGARGWLGCRATVNTGERRILPLLETEPI